MKSALIFIIFSVCSLTIIRCSNISEPGGVAIINKSINSDSAELWQRIAVRYPDFFTRTEDYFVTRISGIPAIDSGTYRLSISGLIDHPCSLSLAELYALSMKEMPVTIECIGNPISGRSISTAVWKGFDLYSLLNSLGLNASATGVKYTAADGYYVTHTMDQLKSNRVLGALFMNDSAIPPIQGFPLRVINPGFYGAKQPAWVTGIEVLGIPGSDYWDDRGWDTSPRMPVDTRIFFPAQNSSFSIGDTVEIGGAGFGGTRIASSEVSVDQGKTWQPARVVRSIDADNVWVFWYAAIVCVDTSQHYIHARSIDRDGNMQPGQDTTLDNGDNAWPYIFITVHE